MKERLASFFERLTSLHRCLGDHLSRLLSLRADLELAHTKVEVGDKENEQVLDENRVCLELNLGNFVHEVHHFAFDAAKRAFGGCMCLSKVLLAQLNDAQIVIVDGLVDRVAKLFFTVGHFSTTTVFTCIIARHTWFLLKSLLPELNSMLVVQ